MTKAGQDTPDPAFAFPRARTQRGVVPSRFDRGAGNSGAEAAPLGSPDITQNEGIGSMAASVDGIFQLRDIYMIGGGLVGGGIASLAAAAFLLFGGSDEPAAGGPGGPGGKGAATAVSVTVPGRSQVARTITGTRWSGPAFFGLKPRKAAA